jgi:Tol biopolymer transport system component
LVGAERTAAHIFSDWSTPETLGPTVNSTLLDGCPAVTRDGLSLYFASARSSGAGGPLDLFLTQRDSADDAWSNPVALGSPLNTASTDFCPAFSRDGHLLFFASNRPGGCGGNDIYVARRQNKRDDFGWEEPRNLGCVVNSASDDFGPNYFETDDGTPVLYFNSNRPGGAGLQDLYTTTLSAEGTFDVPITVIELNSASNDQQSAIRRDGLEIFLTSNRPGGLGAADLWQATRASTSDPWSAPVNMGPVNSPQGDARPALSWDGAELYFGSSRTGGLGFDDLYVIRRAKILGR